MRESNAYHKFMGYGQKASGTGFETLQFPIWFNYYEKGQTQQASNMFKGLVFEASSSLLITEDKKGLVSNDRIYIEGSPALITKIHTTEKQTLSGGRWKTRKKIYIIELEV